ncbi:BnaCnng27980D [Brassica napus]|uniref:BnaCnng27980D protein n=1 Tax=Brassica napus TaxID=3708 RepID=A0A078IUE6_BRANA|nr:BnaCnng27980D [Brassica napus]
MMSRPTNIPLQPWEMALFAEIVRKSSVRQYLLMRVLPSRLSGLLMIRQLSLAR